MTTRPETLREWRAVYGAVILLLAALLAYTTRSVLSPLLVYALLVLLLTPYAGTRRYTLLIVGATVMMFLWLIATLGGLLAPFILAMAIAYILSPVVDALERRRVPRAVGIAILALPLLGLLAVALIFGIPALLGQLQTLVEQIPSALERASTWFDGLRGRLIRMNLPFIEEDQLFRQLDLLSEERVSAYLQERQAEILQRGWGAVLGVGRGIGVVLGILGYVVLTPVLTVY
ncbi:MAG: AI-2E family transporter, partial [Longimicrobiales bacterium]